MSSLSLDEKQAILARVPLFAELEPSAIETIARAATTRHAKARTEIFCKGDEGEQVYIVASGRVKVITTSDTGDDLIFWLVEPGEIVGEVSVLTGRERMATAVAMLASNLIVLERRDFEPLLRTRPEVAYELLQVLAERLTQVSEFIEDTHFLNLPKRLAKKLIEFSSLHGVERAGHERLIDVKLSQEEWGDLVGTTRESINKQFRAWSDEGLITIDKGKIVVIDLDALETLAEDVLD